MIFKSFDELVSVCLKNSNKEEIEKINEELKIIKSRKWEEYFLVGVNILTYSFFTSFFGGSMADSYLFLNQ